MAGQSAKVVELVPRAAPGALPLPPGISHQAAQAELDAKVFPHYLLGRQLALEQVVRELLQELPQERLVELKDRLIFDADLSIRRIQAGIADPKDDAATCGYTCALLQLGG